MLRLLAILTGFGLDYLIGEPQNPLHPVRIIGLFISWLSGIGKKRKSNKAKFLFGAVMAVVTVGLTFLLIWLIIQTFYNVNLFLGFTAESILYYFCVSARGLRDEAEKIRRALSKEDIPDAREKLSFIVGRDTGRLDREQIVKAAVETVSENLSDGVIAPLIFMFIGGAPLAMAYKAVNTLDSMVGYRNSDYEYLGKFAARLDDAVNFIPARISGLLMIPSAYLLKLNWAEALRIFLRDRKNHKSPNSAQTESACAGALGLKLGGPSFYGGKLVDKPFIGDNKKQAEPEDITTASRLMYASSILLVIFGAIIKIIFNK